MITDGGGKRKASMRPMVGRDDVLGLIEGLIWRGSVPLAGTVRLARINGAPGVVLGEGSDVVTVAFDAAPGRQDRRDLCAAEPGQARAREGAT